VVDVPGRIVGMQDQSFDICRTEMKYSGFQMINPDNGIGYIEEAPAGLAITSAGRMRLALGTRN
jgi:hypothetical protein